MTADQWVALAQVIGALLGGGGIGLAVRAFLRRRLTRVEAHVQLNKATLDWAAKLEASADRAWRRAEEAEVKAESANQAAEEADRRADLAEQSARRVQAQIQELARYLDVLLRLIHDPNMTMGRLRESVGDGPPRIP